MKLLKVQGQFAPFINRAEFILPVAAEVGMHLNNSVLNGLPLEAHYNLRTSIQNRFRPK